MKHSYRQNTLTKLIYRMTTLILMLLNSNNVLGVADPALPEEVCASVGADDCSQLTENSTNAQYIDLNQDDTKELVFTYSGGSCGSNYWVFQVNTEIKWMNIGGWCGCEDNIFKIKNTRHNGYFDIWSCGNSGIFDGKEYVETRQ